MKTDKKRKRRTEAELARDAVNKLVAKRDRLQSELDTINGQLGELRQALTPPQARPIQLRKPVEENLTETNENGEEFNDGLGPGRVI